MTRYMITFDLDTGHHTEFVKASTKRAAASRMVAKLRAEARPAQGRCGLVTVADCIRCEED